MRCTFSKISVSVSFFLPPSSSMTVLLFTPYPVIVLPQGNQPLCSAKSTDPNSSSTSSTRIRNGQPARENDSTHQIKQQFYHVFPLTILGTACKTQHQFSFIVQEAEGAANAATRLREEAVQAGLTAAEDPFNVSNRSMPRDFFHPKSGTCSSPSSSTTSRDSISGEECYCRCLW
jgi:hypothetical protein